MIPLVRRVTSKRFSSNHGRSICASTSASQSQTMRPKKCHGRFTSVTDPVVAHFIAAND